MPLVLETATRKAKKEHICSFCELKIEAGETYEDQTIIYDGLLYHWKSHSSCKELARKLKMYDSCYDRGLTADEFQEYIIEFLSGKNIEYFNDLRTWEACIAKAKEMLCGKSV